MNQLVIVLLAIDKENSTKDNHGQGLVAVSVKQLIFVYMRCDVGLLGYDDEGWNGSAEERI